MDGLDELLPSHAKPRVRVIPSFIIHSDTSKRFYWWVSINNLQQQQTWNWSDPEYYQTMKFIMVQDHESMDQNLVHKLLSTTCTVSKPLNLYFQNSRNIKHDSQIVYGLHQIHDCAIFYTNFSFEAFRVVKTQLSAKTVVFYMDSKSSLWKLSYSSLGNRDAIMPYKKYLQTYIQ